MILFSNQMNNQIYFPDPKHRMKQCIKKKEIDKIEHQAKRQVNVK